MKVEVSQKFRKIFKKRFSHQTAIQEKFYERLRLFSDDEYNPILQDHALQGEKNNLRAFSVTGDIRVVYYILNNTAYLIDIGTHNQVY